MIFVHAHSGFRYIALLLGLAVLAYGVTGLMKKRGHDDTLYNLAAGYRHSMDLTLFLGVAVLFSGRFYPAVGTHIVIMIFATLVAHVVPMVMRKREPEERSIMPYLVATGISLALVVVGTVALGRAII